MTLGPRDAILGSANAPVTLIEYGDYQCPFCTKFFSQTEPQIIQDYVNTGKVRMVFRDFAFLGPESTAAANAAQCAEDQNKLWAYHDALYTAKVGDEAKGGNEDDGFYNTAEFLKLAQQVGLTIPAFTSCINSNTDATIVAQEKVAATAAGINSTPSFIINGQLSTGAQPYSVFQQALDAALKG
jgi:protein-disulfide isomerase